MMSSSLYFKSTKGEKMTDKEKRKSAYDMTDDEVAKSVDLEVSDFDESGDMLDELRDIMEGNDA
tara:strand:+ start:423 stop:614 length:192 start_codon:yes stop_codon:yes gene_type:complete